MKDFILPPQLYIPRKTFDFGPELVTQPSINALAESLLAHDANKKRLEIFALEKFWAREHACYTILCRQKGKRYIDYLPGRQYTYLMLRNLICRVMATTSFRALEAGCGSAFTSSLLAKDGVSVVGLDIAESALKFAREIAAEFGVKPDTVLGDYTQLPFLDHAFDLVFSLGAIEHRPPRTQRAYFVDAARVSSRWIIVLIPNTNSPIYKAMEEKEFMIMPAELVYPEEYHLYSADLVQLAESVGLSILETSAIHIVPPRFIPERFLTEESYHFFSSITERALASWNGDAITTWVSVETECSQEEKSNFGWFSYVVCQKTEDNEFAKKPT